jgi:hypothetical protein
MDKELKFEIFKQAYKMLVEENRMKFELSMAMGRGPGPIPGPDGPQPEEIDMSMFPSPPQFEQVTNLSNQIVDYVSNN